MPQKSIVDQPFHNPEKDVYDTRYIIDDVLKNKVKLPWVQPSKIHPKKRKEATDLN